MAFFVGLDLGRTIDYTAMVVLDRFKVEGERRFRYRVPHLQRFALGTSYPTIVDEVGTMLRDPRLRGAKLIVDATGVGLAVVDMLTKAHLRPIAITITSGTEANQVAPNRWNVPKTELVGVMHVLMQSSLLEIGLNLKQAKALRAELVNFQSKVTLDANETFGAWRSGTHDDLVLATAVAAWFAEHGPRPSLAGVGSAALAQGAVKMRGVTGSGSGPGLEAALELSRSLLQRDKS